MQHVRQSVKEISGEYLPVLQIISETYYFSGDASPVIVSNFFLIVSNQKNMTNQ